MKLSKKEKRLLDSVERGDWKTVPDLEKQAERYRGIARSTFRKVKRGNTRFSASQSLSPEGL